MTKSLIEEEVELIRGKSEVINDSLWYVNPKDIEISLSRALLAGEKKGAEGIIERVEEICELHKNIEERTHRVGSHSDDYGGESDYPCDCDNEKRWHKIEAISSILYALQALKTNQTKDDDNR